MQKTINWQRIWHEDKSGLHNPARMILYGVSLFYRLVIYLRNRLYDYQIFREIRLPCRVISVGNITAGGTGKTPCVIKLAQMLQNQGFKPAILSRGYGGKNSRPVNIVSNGVNIFLPAVQAGDEPYLMARTLKNIPVLIGSKRIVSGKTAIEQYGINIILCDDAFQHRQIFRDVNLLLLDGQEPFGNGYLLPRGELREPPAEIRRADAVILTRTNEDMTIAAAVSQLAAAQNIPIFRSVHRALDAVKGDYSACLSLSELKGKKVCAFAGIAKPDSFRIILSEGGMQIMSFDIFPDHHRYSRKELENIYFHFLHSGADLLITTEKDGMRLQELPELAEKIYLLRIELQIIPDDNLLQMFISEKLGIKATFNNQRGSAA